RTYLAGRRLLLRGFGGRQLASHLFPLPEMLFVIIKQRQEVHELDGGVKIQAGPSLELSIPIRHSVLLESQGPYDSTCSDRVLENNHFKPTPLRAVRHPWVKNRPLTSRELSTDLTPVFDFALRQAIHDRILFRCDWRGIRRFFTTVPQGQTAKIIRQLIGTM